MFVNSRVSLKSLDFELYSLGQRNTEQNCLNKLNKKYFLKIFINCVFKVDIFL